MSEFDEQKSDNPEIQWALDLLKPEANFKPSLMKEYTAEVICVGSGFLIACGANWLSRRPFYTGIQVHVASMIGGFVLSKFIKKSIDIYQAERDTRLREYIKLHPELFPKPVRVKYSEVLEPWCPIR